MDVSDMTIKDFKKLELIGWKNKIPPFRSLVILPTKKMHDSGYRCMEFVAVDKEGEAICRMSGCSDVLNIDGTRSIEVKGWSIDCLPKSGLLRIFCNGDLDVGSSLSSFEIFGKSK